MPLGIPIKQMTLEIYGINLIKNKKPPIFLKVKYFLPDNLPDII